MFLYVSIWINIKKGAIKIQKTFLFFYSKGLVQKTISSLWYKKCKQLITLQLIDWDILIDKQDTFFKHEIKKNWIFFLLDTKNFSFKSYLRFYWKYKTLNFIMLPWFKKSKLFSKVDDIVFPFVIKQLIYYCRFLMRKQAESQIVVLLLKLKI